MGQLGLDNLPFLGFGAQKRKVGAQVRTFVRNARGPSKMSFVWSENPHGPPKRPPKYWDFCNNLPQCGFCMLPKSWCTSDNICPKFMWAKQNVFSFVRKPPQTPQKAPQILEIPFFDTFAQIGSVRND